MPAKKAAPRDSGSMGMGDVWKWVFLIGVVLAGLAAVVNIPGVQPFLGWLLLLAGILVGLFWRDTEDLKGFGIRYLMLGVASGGLAMGAAAAAGADIVSMIWGYVTAFFAGVFGFLGPVALATLFMYFWRKYFGNMM